MNSEPKGGAAVAEKNGSKESFYKWVAGIAVPLLLAILSAWGGHWFGVWDLGTVKHDLSQHVATGHPQTEAEIATLRAATKREDDALAERQRSQDAILQGLATLANENARALSAVDANLRILLQDRGLRPVRRDGGGGE